MTERFLSESSKDAHLSYLRRSGHKILSVDKETDKYGDIWTVKSEAIHKKVMYKRS